MQKIKIETIEDINKKDVLSTFIIHKKMTIMINCGLSYLNDLTPYERKTNLLKKVDLLIVTSSELNTCGALLYLINKYNYHVS